MLTLQLITIAALVARAAPAHPSKPASVAAL